jgi:exopolysaccharide production protein ExoQ
MKKVFSFCEQVFVVFSLQLYSGGIIYLILSGGASQGEQLESPPDYALARQLLLVIYAITIFLLFLRWRRTLYFLSKDKFISPLIIIAIISILWSDNPTRTFNGNVALLGTTAFGVYLATRYSLKQQLQLLGWTFVVAIILSLIFAVALPKYGIMSGIHTGSWRGIYTHKNVLGKMMVIGASVFWLLAIFSPKNRWLYWFSFGLSVLLILLSTSKTSFLNLIIMLAIFTVCHLFRWQEEIMLSGIMALLLVGSVLSIYITFNAEFFVKLLGKDLTFTGRIPLWLAILDLIKKNPWIGYGYNSLWDSWDSVTAYVWFVVGGWEAPSAHNGFLDLLLALGLLGFLIFLFGFLYNFAKSIIQLRLIKTVDGFWPIMFMVYFILANLSETSLMQPNNIFWIIYVKIAFTLLAL